MSRPIQTRPWLLLIITITVPLLWLNVFLVWRAARPQPGEMTTAPAVRPDLAGAVGVSLEPAELEGDRLAPTLARLDQAGIRWLRLRLPWDEIEPAAGQFNWSRWDAIFAALAGRPDLQLLVVLDGSPAWARDAADADNPLAPPHERADFGAFAAAVANRYGAHVRYYQLWHEPNIAPHWGARPADPADYLGLLREGAVQIRAVDRDALIVLAALAPTTEPGGTNLSDVAYLDALYRLGARAWFDIVAAQPYGFDQAATARPSPATLNFGRVALLRDVMVRHRDADTPIWATAFGWNALPAGWAGRLSPWGQVSEEEQARYAAAALELAGTRWPWLGPLFWPANCPPRPADDPWRGFSLCAADGSPRPIWQALADAARRPLLLPPGDHAVDHPALHYSPGWRVTTAAADPAASGDTLTFTFYGRGLALRVQGGPYWAYYRINIDGAPANALPRDESGAAYLVLHDPLAATRVVSVADRLALGQHQAQIEAFGGWGQWALQGVLVSYDAPLAIGWPAWALLAGLATLLWGMLVWLLARPSRFVAFASFRAFVIQTPSWFDAAGLGLAALLVVALMLSPWLFLDLAVLAGLGLLFLIRPHLALPLIAASIPFWPHPKPLLRWEFSLFEILVTLAVASRIVYCLSHLAYDIARVLPRPNGRVMARSRATKEQSPPTGQSPTLTRLDFPVLALLLVGLAATVAAEGLGVAAREFRIVFLDGALFYWLITRLPWPEGRRFSPWPLVDGLLVGMVIVSGMALWQLVSGQGRVDVEGVWRVRALYGSPNNLALVLDRAVPLALALAAFGFRTVTHAAPAASAKPPCGTADEIPHVPGTSEVPGTWGIFRAGRRVFYALAALVTAAACLATFSKGALLLGLPAGVGLVLLAGAWRARRRWPLAALGGLALLAAMIVLLLSRTPRFADLFNFQAGTTFFRLKLWQGAWQMALDHPWLGVGPDNFLYAYRTRYVLPSAWQELNLSHPHNIVLDLWTRLGVFGLLAGGWAIVAAARCGWRLFRTTDSATWPLALGLLGGLAATVAHGLIDNSLFLVDLMALFMLALGVMRRIGESPVPNH